MKTACVDIGGTYIKTGVLEHGQLSMLRETPTNAQEGAEAMLARVADLIRAMPDVECVGISTAGEVEPDTGCIRFACNIPGYTGLNPKEILQNELNLPVAVENDVNAAAVGEYAFGAAKNARNFLMLTFGTGIGGAAVVDGRLYRGGCGSAGEFGGLITHPEAIDPNEQGTGSYERYASTTALVKRVNGVYPEITTGREIFARLEDPQIKAEVDAWINEIVYGLVTLIHAFNPEIIVLGGGIMHQPYIQEQLNRRLYPLLKPTFRECRLKTAELGNQAGLMGAGHLVNLEEKRKTGADSTV